MKCANCAWSMPDSWRRHPAGRKVCCSKKCATEFAFAELARLERHLSNIIVKTRGMAKDLASIALNSNQDPP